MALIGWSADIPVFKSIVPGYATMKINTAIGFLLTGVSILLLTFPGAKQTALARFLATMLAILSIATLAEYHFDTSFGIDEAIVNDIETRLSGHLYPGRMSYATALCFLLMGVAAALVPSPKTWVHIVAQYMFYTLFLISSLGLIGFILNVPEHYKLSALQSMSIPTSTLFIIASLTTSLYHSQAGFSKLFTGRGAGSLMFRRLFPLISIMAIVLGIVRVISHRLMWVNEESGIALMTLAFFIISTFFIIRTAEKLNLTDQKKNTAEAELSKLNNHLEQLVEKRSEELRIAKERLALATSASGIGIWDWDVVSNNLIWDDEMRRIYNVDENDIGSTYQCWRNSLHPSDHDATLREVQAALDEKKPFNTQFRIVWNDGSVRYISASAIIQFNAKNEPVRMVGTNLDITPQKLAENRLTESNNRSRIFIEQAPGAIAMFDTDMKYLAASEQWVTDYGLSGKEIIGKSHYDIFPEIGDDWKAIHKQCLSGAVNKNDDAYFLRNDGSEQWIQWDVRPWYVADGEIGGLLMYTADITNRKVVERQLELSEKRFRGAFEHSATGMAVISLEGKWVEVNRAICNIIGYTAAELKKLTFQDITHPEDLEKDLTLVKELIDNKRDFYHMEKRYFHKSGQVIWILLSVSIVRDSDGEPLYFVSQITDINRQKVAQKSLEEALVQIESLLDASSQVSIIGTDTTGLITTFNRGAENLLGYSRDEVLYHKTPEIVHLKEEVADRGAELTELLGKPVEGFDVFVELAKKQKYETREWTYVKKDGSRFPVQLTVTAVKFEGQVSGYLGVAADITELKNAERELKSVLKVTEDQNERLKNFAHIVSHNLRSHSGNFSVLLELFVQENPEAAKNEMVQMLVQASDNLKKTIAELNEVVLMNTVVSDSLVAVNLNSKVQSAISNVSALAAESGVTIDNQTNPDALILGIPAYLDSIIINFLTNGIKYRSDERVSHVQLTTDTENEYIVLSVMDNGIGMDLEKIGEKLFGMYNTFHGNSDARGVGLFITKNQIEAMGGKIEVESTVGIGTKFKIFFKNANC